MNSQVPFGIFFSRIPHGKVMTGTEDAKVVAIPNPGLRPLICSYFFKGGGTVAAYVSSNYRRMHPVWYSIDESEL